MSQKKALAILVGGGPAPGINGVISAAATEALNRGVKVYGVKRGFEFLSRGDVTCATPLTLDDVATIHRDGGSYLGTSRANPKKSPELLENVVKTLQELNVGYLVTIGGDDTASSAEAVSRAAAGGIAVGHVPKTIDNDLPLPDSIDTFGYQTAREVGTQIAETLMVDARTTNRWYFVVAMGRKAGHLALGIGISSGATLTLIPEEFPDQMPLSLLVDIIAASMLKRLSTGRDYGTVVLAEGLLEKLDANSIPELENAERDPHGHIRYAELDFGGILKRAVRKRLSDLGQPKLLVVEKNVGYELRCHDPVSYDQEYTRVLGFGVVDFLLKGGSKAMISRQRDTIVPIPFQEIMDPSTGAARVRYVDMSSDLYRTAQKFMIKLTESDLKDSDFVQKVIEGTTLTPQSFQEQFKHAAAFGRATVDSVPRTSER